MSKKMQKALLAFINEDKEQAKHLLRQVFIESAQKVNKELEESFDADADEDEELQEGIDADPEKDLEGEVEYKLDEGWGFDEQVQEQEEPEFGAEPEAEGEGEGESEMPFDAEGEDDVEPEGDKWKEMQTMIDELAEVFDSLQQDEGVEGTEPEEEFGEFDDVGMGDQKFGESYKMKPVQAPSNTEASGVNKRSTVAPNAKSPVDGVKPVKITNGSVDVTDTKFENSDTESVKTEDNCNVMDNTKGAMKPVKVPKHTAEKGRSPLPKQK